jgi:hypothetical protein
LRARTSLSHQEKLPFCWHRLEPDHYRDKHCREYKAFGSLWFGA